MRFKSLAWVCAALLLLAPAARAEDAGDKVSKETIESGGRKRTYYLYAPASLKPQAPLVVLLHGSGRDGLSLVERWKDLAAREGFLLAGPNARDSKGWSTPDDGPDFIRDLVEALKSKYQLDARRVYLFGHSAGAVFALNLLMMESEYFAAAAVHAGAWRQPNEFAVLEHAKRKTSLAIVVGDRDPFFPIEAVRATEAALKGGGHEIVVTVMPGHDHWYYDLAPGINRGVWDFLKTKTLDADPKYATYASTSAARDFNTLIKEINALRAQGSESLRLFNASEAELRAKRGDAAVAAALLRRQVELAAAGAQAFRDAANATGRVGALHLPEGYRQYFSLVALADAKRAEGFDVLKARAELQLAGGQSAETLTQVNAAALKYQKLFEEADELERQADRVQPGLRQ